METDLRWFGVVYMWFGANMAGRRNKNAFRYVLQVLILSQTQPLSIKNVVWGGLEVVWGGLDVVWGVLGWFGVFPRTQHSVYNLRGVRFCDIRGRLFIGLGAGQCLR